MEEEVNDLCLCTMALNARPSLQLVVKLWMLTLGYLQKPDQNSLIIDSTQQNQRVIQLKHEQYKWLIYLHYIDSVYPRCLRPPLSLFSFQWRSPFWVLISLFGVLWSWWRNCVLKQQRSQPLFETYLDLSKESCWRNMSHRTIRHTHCFSPVLKVINYIYSRA